MLASARCSTIFTRLTRELPLHVCYLLACARCVGALHGGLLPLHAVISWASATACLSPLLCSFLQQPRLSSRSGPVAVALCWGLCRCPDLTGRPSPPFRRFHGRFGFPFIQQAQLFGAIINHDMRIHRNIVQGRCLKSDLVCVHCVFSARVPPFHVRCSLQLSLFHLAYSRALFSFLLLVRTELRFSPIICPVLVSSSMYSLVGV